MAGVGSGSHFTHAKPNANFIQAARAYAQLHLRYARASALAAFHVHARPPTGVCTRVHSHFPPDACKGRFCLWQNPFCSRAREIPFSLFRCALAAFAYSSLVAHQPKARSLTLPKRALDSFNPLSKQQHGQRKREARERANWYQGSKTSPSRTRGSSASRGRKSRRQRGDARGDKGSAGITAGSGKGASAHRYARFSPKLGGAAQGNSPRGAQYQQAREPGAPTCSRFAELNTYPFSEGASGIERIGGR